MPGSPLLDPEAKDIEQNGTICSLGTSFVALLTVSSILLLQMMEDYRTKPSSNAWEPKGEVGGNIPTGRAGSVSGPVKETTHDKPMVVRTTGVQQ